MVRAELDDGVRGPGPAPYADLLANHRPVEV